MEHSRRGGKINARFPEEKGTATPAAAQESVREARMKHYIAIFVEDSEGEWRVVFPDVPDCQAKGFALNDATHAARSALGRCISERGSPPSPMDMESVRRNKEWLELQHIDLAKAVVTMIDVAA